MIITVMLSDKQYNALVEMADKQGVTIEECLRTPIDSYIALKDSGIDLFRFAQELGKGAV